MNAWREQYLRGWTNNKRTWARMLPTAEYAHNSWKHNATRKSPHELLLGMKPQIHVKFIPEHVRSAEIRIKDLERTRQQVQSILEAQQKRKQKRHLTEMKVGDQVLLEGTNLHVQGTRKLLPKWYGLYQIIERISPVAYRLKLPPTMKIHNVFHIDLLLPYKETEEYGPGYTRPPPDIVQGEEEYEVEYIREERQREHGKKREYLVHWAGYPASDDSWVSECDLNAPELLAEFHKQSATAGRTNV